MREIFSFAHRDLFPAWSARTRDDTLYLHAINLHGVFGNELAQSAGTVAFYLCGEKTSELGIAYDGNGVPIVSFAENQEDTSVSAGAVQSFLILTESPSRDEVITRR